MIDKCLKYLDDEINEIEKQIKELKNEIEKNGKSDDSKNRINQIQNKINDSNDIIIASKRALDSTHGLLCQACGSSNISKVKDLSGTSFIYKCNECNRKSRFNLSYINLFGLTVYANTKTELLY